MSILSLSLKEYRSEIVLSQKLSLLSLHSQNSLSQNLFHNTKPSHLWSLLSPPHVFTILISATTEFSWYFWARHLLERVWCGVILPHTHRVQSTQLQFDPWNKQQIFITPSKERRNKDHPYTFKDERAIKFTNHLKSSDPQTLQHKALNYQEANQEQILPPPSPPASPEAQFTSWPYRALG